MPRINLLPWREDERKKRQRDFGISMGASIVAAVIVVATTIFTYSQMIDYQRSRNLRLENEIVELDKSIFEINGLENQKERLLARMEIIEQLQRSRPEIVHLFDEITRQLPEGVYLSGMKQSGIAVQLMGVAQSSTRVSALMRQIESSEWLTDPGVDKVETTESGPTRQAAFVVNLKQISSQDPNQEFQR